MKASKPILLSNRHGEAGVSGRGGRHPSRHRVNNPDGSATFPRGIGEDARQEVRAAPGGLTALVTEIDLNLSRLELTSLSDGLLKAERTAATPRPASRSSSDASSR